MECRENGVSQASSPRYPGDCGLAVFTWPWVGHRMKLCNITRRSVLTPWHLCVHLVSKGVWTSHGATQGSLHTWIAPPQNKGMSDIPLAPWIFFYLLKSWVNLPGLEWLHNRVHAIFGQKLLNTQQSVNKHAHKSPIRKWANALKESSKKIHWSKMQPLTTMPAGTLIQLGF